MRQSSYNSEYYDPDSLNIDNSGYRSRQSGPNDNRSETEEEPKQQQSSSRRGKKSKPTKKGDKEKQVPSVIAFFMDKRLRLFLGITLLLIAAYLLICSISFLGSGDEDQSRIINNTVEQLALSGEPVNNTGGPFGAYLSQKMITESLGLGAFVVIFYIIAIGLSLIGLKKFNFWSLTFKSLILTVTTSIVIGFVTIGISGSVYWGGYHGYHVNAYLIAMTGTLGALCVSIALVSLIAAIFFNDIVKAYTSSRAKIQAQRERMRRIQEEKEEQQKMVDEEMQNTVLSETNQAEPEQKESSTPEPVEFDDPFDQPTDDTNRINDINDNEGPHDELAAKREESIDSDGPSMNVTVKEIETADEITEDAYDPTAELSRYRFPSLDLLKEISTSGHNVDQEEQEENKERITKTLNDYEIPISHIEATVGPTVTLYEIIPAEGVRIAKIKRLEDDIALSLAAKGIRIIAPIPGKGTIGIEVPNQDPQTVSIRSVIGSRKFQECKYELPMAMGATIDNEVFIADLTKMPHLLVAGATGQGKSVGLNTIIASLLYKKHPAELKFVLVDPKMVEFSLYRKLERHYLAKLPDEEEAIITDPLKVVTTLNSLCVEMDNRYNLLKNADVRSIKEYNAKFIARRLNPEKGHRYLPYIVMIVDEFADLIMTAGKEVETPIARIAQKARAVGMHLIIATQRPSTNVITGIIKANFPGRIAFRVSQMVDSRTILDRPGANQLIGRGDMLFSINGEMDRVQCAFIDTPEVEAICNSIDEQIGYDHAYLLPEYIPDTADGGNMSNVADRDPLFEEAARYIINSNTASTSSLQRRYSIGYNRAGKIMDQMEAAGIVGPAQGGKPRQVLIDSLQLERMLEIMDGN